MADTDYILKHAKYSAGRAKKEKKKKKKKTLKMCLYNIICKCRCTLEEHEEHSFRKVWVAEEKLLQLHIQTLLRM